MAYDNSMDAHQNSNWNEFNKIENVIVDVSKFGVTKEAVREIINCMRTGKKFVLYTHKKKGEEISLVSFDPASISCYQNFELHKYGSLWLLMNVVKLVLVTHNNLYIPDAQFPKQISGRRVLPKRRSGDNR